jgi:hypothetical protein
MSIYLSLEGATLVHLRGWGQVAKPGLNANGFRIELADIGELTVYRVALLRAKKLLSMSIAHMQLTADTEQITTGGGWVGGGQGITGALAGSYQARVLNALSTRTREYTLLAAVTTLPNGTKREAIFAFRNLNESDLRDRLATATHAWADGYVEATLTKLRQEPIHGPALQATHVEIDRMQERRMLDPAQALTLRSEASKPFIDALTARLQSGNLDQKQIKNVTAEINNLRQRGRLTDLQAQQIHAQLATLTAPAADEHTTAIRIRQVQALAPLVRG